MNSNPTQKGLDNPTSTLERPPTLPLVLASFSLHDVSISQEKSCVVIPITISSQSDHISCSALVNTGSPVTLLGENIQRQLILPATQLKSHYHLVGATGDTLTTLGTVQVDIVSDSKIWPTLAIVLSSLAHPLILGLNFLKLTKSKIDFNTNNVEIGSEIHPADVHCITNSSSTITIPTSDIYRPCRLLLNKKTCWMVAIMLNIVIIITAVASHTHCHFNPPFKKQDKPIVSPAQNLTWKELLAYGTLVRLTVRSQPARSEKTGQLYFLDWTLSSVLAKRLHISNHLALVPITHYILKITP